MIIITHIGKTGGTSFRGYLEQTFGSRLYMDYPSMPWAGLPRWRWLASWLQGGRGPVPLGVECVIGHFRANKYDELFPNARHGVWLRDPVQRAISHYHHVRRNPDSRGKAGRAVHQEGLTLEQFARRRWAANVHLRALAGKPLAAFDFLGITEHFEIGLKLCARVFGLPEPKAVARRNDNPERKTRGYDIEPELHELIRQANLPDIELYQQAQVRFAELCQRHGLALPEQQAA